MLGIRLYTWQIIFLNHVQEEMAKPEGEREFVAITSRQIGKSTAIAIFLMWSALFNKYKGTAYDNTSALVVSASDVQAKKLLYEIKKSFKLGNRFMKIKYRDNSGPLFGENFFDDLMDDKEPNNTTTITLKAHNPEIHGNILLAGSKSGSTIKSYPPTSGVLGETASIVIIDEAGMTDKVDDQFFYDYLYPTGNSTNAVRIYTSTPWVPNGFFYRMVDPDDMYKDTPATVVLFTIDAIRIENPQQYKTVMNTIRQLNADGKTSEVQRAYYCRFVKGEKSYFDPDDVNDCFTKEYDMVESYNGQCDLGVDFGAQKTSESVLTVSELTDEGVVRRLYHRKYPVGTDNTLIDDIRNLMKDFNIQRIIPDDCPAGSFMINEMIDLGWDVHPMNFRADKVKKYGAFRSMLKRHRMRSYVDDDLKTEMLALEFGQGAKNSIIQHAPNYSDDLIDSFLMSTYFFIQEDEGVQFFDYNDYEKDTKKGNISRLFSRKRPQFQSEGFSQGI